MSAQLRLSLILFPLGAGAMAVNVFFASLIASWAGWGVWTPYQSVIAGLILGWPATWLFARHIRRLMALADREKSVCETSIWRWPPRRSRPR